jgi:hypothetical protein
LVGSHLVELATAVFGCSERVAGGFAVWWSSGSGGEKTWFGLSRRYEVELLLKILKNWFNLYVSTGT